MIMAEGVMRTIRATHAGDHITLLTEPFYAKFFKNAPHFDAFLTDSRPPRWHIHKMLKLRRLLKAHKFDIVYDLQNSNRSHFYHRWLKPAKISSRFHDSHFYFDHKKILKENPDIATRDLLAAQIKSTGINIDDNIIPDLSWAKADPDTIPPLLKAAGITPPFILLIPGSSARNSEKRWPYYKDLAQMLAAKNIPCATAPGPDEIDLCRSIPAPLLPDLSFPQMIALAPHIAYVVGNDTGPTHLMAYSGTNGLAFFNHHKSYATRSGINQIYDVITANDLATIKPAQIIPHIETAYSNSV